MSKTIEITVLPSGQTKVETKGFAGAECQQASQFIERALGHVGQKVLKAEFYAKSSNQNSVQNGN